MSRKTQEQSGPGGGDPRTIDPDGSSPLRGLPSETMRPDVEETEHFWMKCYHKGIPREFVGYLSWRGNQTAAIGEGADYPPAEVYWYDGPNGDTYLGKETSPYDRFLGMGDYWYACWALWQVRNMGYFTNVIYNPDHTISPGTYPRRFLAGPYEQYGINWVWWAPEGDPNILVCELVPIPPKT